MAGKKERQRRLARERYLRQQARRAQRAHRARLIGVITLACCAVAGLSAGGYFAFGGGGKPASAASATPATTAGATPSASATPSAVAEPAHHCTYTASPPASRKVSPPPATPDWRARYQASIATNRGDVVIDLLNSKAACTVSSFVHLADQKFFAGTPCHRLTTSGIYVLQCGDPTGTGTGGPGYKFADENLPKATQTTGGVRVARYPATTVAMANTGAGTNGSQFFLVYRDSALPPDYTPFGRIIKGLDIIQSVARAGTANGTGDGHPKEKVIIESVTIKKT